MTLIEAAQAGDLQAVQNLLDRGVEAPGDQELGEALCTAAFHGHREVVELLLSHGADVDARGAGGETPLHCAIENIQPEVVTLLLKHGADVNAANVWE